MMGDAVDNIPGLPGVGEKQLKAISRIWFNGKFISKYRQTQRRFKRKIEANKEKGILSKKLATILLDCPVTFDEKKDYELSKPDVEKTDIIFQELEFRQMKTQFDKLFGSGKEYDEIETNGTDSNNIIKKLC